MRIPERRRYLVIALLGISASAPVAAQETAAPDPVEESTEVDAPVPPPLQGVESIEVTGERMDGADVQDEAQAITAFSAEDLDRANIVGIDSLQFNVPGLHVGQTGQQAIVTLRGVGTENASITGEPGVAFHVDGVNYAQPSAARVAFFDLETLDIKRGPQGLKGGKNSTSGTINVVTRKPHDQYEVSGDFLMGNYDRRRVRGAVNLPLGELLALRAAVLYEGRDGFLDDRNRSDDHDAFDADDFGFRTHLRLTPRDTLEILLTYNYFQQGGAGPQSDIVPIKRTHDCGVTSALPEIAACYLPTLRATEDADPRSLYVNFPSSQDTQFWGWTGRVEWDVPELPLLGETRLVGIGGFQQSEVDFRSDFDSVDLWLLELDSAQEVYQNTAELQWSGTAGDERIEWQASGYFARERGKRSLEVSSYIGNLNPEPEDPFPLTVDQDTENSALGASLHTLLHVTDNVRFELGGRWIRDEKRTGLFRHEPTSDRLQQFVGCQGSLVDSTFEIQPTPWCGETYRGQMWGAGLDWRPFGSDHLLYTRLDRGYKSGGFRSGQRGLYLPESNWAYAVGSKSEFFDSRVQLNLEGFVYNYQDMQLVVLDGVSLRTENADTRMYGWDLEARASPIEGLDLGAIVSFLKTEVREYYTLDPADLYAYNGPASDLVFSNGARAKPRHIFAYNQARLFARDSAENLTSAENPVTYAERRCFGSVEAASRGQLRAKCGTLTNFPSASPNGGFDDFSGNELSRAPRWKITLSGGYEIALGRFGSVTPRVQYSWQDDTYFRAFNRDFDLQEAYHLTDVKLEWKSPEERWDAEVFVQNIEDEAPKHNILIGGRAFGSPPFAWYGPPRFYGVRVGFKY